MSAHDAARQPEPMTLPPPIIVLGTRSTAVAVVGAMLGRNSAAFAFPQLNLFVSETLEGVVTAAVDTSNTHLHGLLRALAYIYGSEQTIISVGMARRWIMRRLPWPTSQVFDELRRRVAPQRVIDKSPVYSRNAKCLERIRKSSPDAYYVHVIEHPLTPGAATKRNVTPNTGQQSPNDKVSPRDQLQWLEAQRGISQGLTGVAPERLAVLRMESLLADPRSALADLCGRLDLPNDETAVADMLHPEHSPFAGPGPVGANVGDDPAFLRDPTFPPKTIPGPPDPSQWNEKDVVPEVAQFAAQYGYDRVGVI